VATNPVKGTKRPKVESQEGKTPALGDHQARALLRAPDAKTLRGLRDRALLSVVHLRVHGKGGKLRYVPLHPATSRRLDDYLQEVGHADKLTAPLFQALGNASQAGQGITADGVYKMLLGYLQALQLDGQGLGRTPCVPRPPPTRLSTTLTSPRCRSGLGTRTSPLPASTTAVRCGPRTHRLSKSSTDLQRSVVRPRMRACHLTCILALLNFEWVTGHED
jgi:hypothetical protein